MRTTRCPYCDSPSVVDRPATTDRPDPSFVVGFTIDRNEARNRVRGWIKRKRFRPSGLETKTAERVSGIYLPTYLYSAAANTGFSATIGEDYYTTEVSRDSKGRTRVKRKRRTEFFDLRGSHEAYVGDVVVTASRGIPNNEVEAIEPFDLSGMRRYVPAMVSGWSSEEPSMTRDECLQHAREESSTKIGWILQRFMPGDSFRGLRRSTRLDNEALDLVLLPLWIFAIRYDAQKPPIRILVNGQTGRAGGEIPTSWTKVAILVATILGLLAVPGILAVLVGLLQ
jgi:hypothetical protein